LTVPVDADPPVPTLIVKAHVPALLATEAPVPNPVSVGAVDEHIGEVFPDATILLNVVVPDSVELLWSTYAPVPLDGAPQSHWVHALTLKESRDNAKNNDRKIVFIIEPF
jgi:hypothetical protein